MGGLCCCPGREELEEYVAYPIFQNCVCIRCCARWCLRVGWFVQYAPWFERGEGRDSPNASQGATASPAAGLLGTTSLGSSLPDTFRAPPRPLPYDIDPRYLRTPRDGLVSRRDKSGMSHLHGVETEPLRRSSNGGDGGGEVLTQLPRRAGPGPGDFDEPSQGYRPDSPGKRQSPKRVEPMPSLVDDEDACPTCLDEYTKENPKIPTACGHHFHLGCIYEWAERSKRCPICDKVFDHFAPSSVITPTPLQAERQLFCNIQFHPCRQV